MPYSRRRMLDVLFSLTALTILLCVCERLGSRLAGDTFPRLEISPPLYKNLKKVEEALPQHDLLLAFPEGKKGRYVKFSNQITMLGWNNVLTELLMNAHLAHASNRAYVFMDYAWSPDHYPWPQSQQLQNPPRTPLSALLGGTVVGQPFESGDRAPRSISSKWFDVVCPTSERRIVYTSEVKAAVAWSQGNEIFEHWEKFLRDAPESCIEIKPSSDDNFPQTFDLWLWGSDRVLSLWDSFSKSPTSRLLRASDIVHDAVKQNENLFIPWSHRRTIDPYTGLMAMHIRRGDYVNACKHLAYWNSTFYSWNQLPYLPDRLEFAPSITWNTTEYFDAHTKKCFPDVDDVTAKARQLQQDYAKSAGQMPPLEVVYILTNERGPWLKQLKKSLENDGWRKVLMSHDLTLDSEGIEVGMAIDMEIARQAAVFVGNGWSSFTSNVNHRRLIDGMKPFSIRFWS